MKTRNPGKDKVAIVGIGTTPYERNSGKSLTRLTVEAAIGAIRDAAISVRDIDGISGSTTTIDALTLQAALGIPELSWWANPPLPFTNQVIEAANAVIAGVCDTVLVYHSNYRTFRTSRSAASDPFRARLGPGHHYEPDPDAVTGPVGHAAWANRYLQEFAARREYLGWIALNGRAHASNNPHAAIRDPLTMEDYLSAPILRYPLTKYDMDYPVDAGDAIVITTTERARDLPHSPVILHVATLGVVARGAVHGRVDQLPSLLRTGQEVVAERLWARSDIQLPDIDLFFPYDGFSIIALRWFEGVGYCPIGEAGRFIEANWSAERARIEIDGRVLVNTHGGGLSEGAVQGANHVREAVLQLRGDANVRQVANVSTALVTPGTFLHNAGGMILHRVE